MFVIEVTALSHGADSTKAIYYAFSANGAIAITKYVAAVITGSGSMLAEAVHSTADCGNQLLLLLGMKRSKKPASDRFPLGYGKETYFWSFIVALLLFSSMYAIVAIKLKLCVITSSPALTPKAFNPILIAAVPDVTANEYLQSILFEKFFSNSLI